MKVIDQFLKKISKIEYYNVIYGMSEAKVVLDFLSDDISASINEMGIVEAIGNANLSNDEKRIIKDKLRLSEINTYDDKYNIENYNLNSREGNYWNIKIEMLDGSIKNIEGYNKQPEGLVYLNNIQEMIRSNVISQYYTVNSDGSLTLK